MERDFEHKLKVIGDVWNNFILYYKYCSSKIKFNEEAKSNYFGDLLGYFNDVNPIVFPKITRYADYTAKFSFTISFLQAVYVQQDFIEEMLILFKTSKNRGDLNGDNNYTINREIRNEIVGHPISRDKGKLESSTVFSYQSEIDEIQYLRYHVKNSFKFEIISHKISAIQERHEDFLETYLDIVIDKLKIVLKAYRDKLDNLINQIGSRDIKVILTLVDCYFEGMYESNFLYERELLLLINARKDEHPRYQNLLDCFFMDLKRSLIEMSEYTHIIFERRVYNDEDSIPLIIDIEVVHEPSEIKTPHKETYHYELSKLATRRDLRDFEFFGGILRNKCQDNAIVLEELDHMESNIYDVVEYYCAYRLICCKLKED